ncbi:MAG: lysophospholipase, partial [Candidatus Dormibacteraceae bacterium]
LADQPRGVVTVIHGLGEHSGRYQALAEAMTTRGWSCYGVDLRGMGRSPGRRGHISSWQQWIDDASAFHQMVCQENPDLEVVPLGHSFGGVVLITAILAEAIRPERFVLTNPALRSCLKVPGWKLRLGRIANRLLPALTLPSGAEPELDSRDPQVVEEIRQDPLGHPWISARLHAEWSDACELALNRAAEIKTPYLLILSGDDALIDASTGQEFSARSNCSQVVSLYPGRFHAPFIDLGSEEVFADLSEWLINHA